MQDHINLGLIFIFKKHNILGCPKNVGFDFLRKIHIFPKNDKMFEVFAKFHHWFWLQVV